MAVFRPRNRLVYFRVSEDEFQQLTRACEQEGARSLSDLARSAMQRAVNESNEAKEEPVTNHLKKLDGAIGELSTRVEQLTVLIEEKIVNSRRKSNLSAKGMTNGETA